MQQKIKTLVFSALGNSNHSHQVISFKPRHVQWCNNVTYTVSLIEYYIFANFCALPIIKYCMLLVSNFDWTHRNCTGKISGLCYSRSAPKYTGIYAAVLAPTVAPSLYHCPLFRIMGFKYVKFNDFRLPGTWQCNPHQLQTEIQWQSLSQWCI